MNNKERLNPATTALSIWGLGIITLLLGLCTVASFLVLLICWHVAGCSGLIQAVPGLLTAFATFLLVVVTMFYVRHTRSMAETMARQTEGDLLIRLGELYAHPDTRKAIRVVYDTKYELKELFQENRYRFAESFLNDSKPGSDKDSLRWHLVNFWYTLADLTARDIIKEESVFSRFGPPNVIEILEPIEAAWAYELELRDNPTSPPESFTRDWPPLTLFVTWAKKCAKDRVPPQKQLPAFPEEFNRWARDYVQRRPSGIQP